MDTRQVLLEVIVGSQLHRLADENSDTDKARVVAAPLRDVLSPFKNEDEGLFQDETMTYELRKFMKLATQGNPTILEVLWSDMWVARSLLGWGLQTQRQALLDSRRVFQAHLGYAQAQRQKLERSTDEKRIGKCAATYLRILDQGIQLLRDKDFNPAPQRNVELMRQLKKGATYLDVARDALPIAAALEEELKATYEQAEPFTPDFEWIEEYIFEAYTKTGYSLVVR